MRITGPDRRSLPARIRPAPDSSSTPIAGTFGLSVDPATLSWQEGRVRMGGSPLRLLRLPARAVALVSGWDDGGRIGDNPAEQRLARRLVASGAFHPRPGPATFSPADVTVVIPVQNRPAALEHLLRTLGGLARIVVDDGSIDAELNRKIATQAGARFIALPVNAGPSAARNAGLVAAMTPLVAFVDSDCTPSEDWLVPLLGHFDDPLVAAVAPRVTSAPATSANALSRYEAVRSSLDRGPREGTVRPQSRIPYVPSAALVVRRDVAADPFFDPTLRGGEDVDLVWRLVEAGWVVRYVPTSTVAHQGPATAGSFFRRRSFYGTSAGPLARRHPASLAPLQTSVWTAAVWGLAAARRPILASLTLGVSVLLLAHRLRGLIDQPIRVALTIAGGGAVKSALPALSGLTRAWSPALVVGLFFRRTRRVAALALLAPSIYDEMSNPGHLDPVRYTALHVADDIAYGAGVWRGCAAASTVRPLLPQIVVRSRIWGQATLQSELGGTA
jgi:mycofactocin system glycosyltransferase